MAEYIQGISITVEVDTNKRTLSADFDNREDFEAWWRVNVEGIDG